MTCKTDEMREAFEKQYGCSRPYDEYDERASYVWDNSWQAATASAEAKYKDALREAREALEIAKPMMRGWGAPDNDIRIPQHRVEKALTTINKLLGEK